MSAGPSPADARGTRDEGPEARVRLTGLFESEGKLRDALAATRAGDVRVAGRHSPVPPEHGPTEPPSGIRAWVLTGALAGLGAGFALTIGTALYWPLRVGGKPIVSLPAFAIIAFELTILLAAIVGLLGFLRAAGLPSRASSPDYRQEAGIDRFSLTLACPAARRASVRERLLAAGAVTVIERVPGK